MTTRERVQDLYQRFPQPRSFEEDVELYHNSGYVIETREVYVMGKAVKHDAPWEAIVNPQVSFARHVQDAWFLHAMAGSLRAMWEVKPYYLPLIGWSRRGRRIHWHWIDDAHHAINALIPPVRNFLVLTGR
jgi:hypothetical protein